VKKMIVQVKLRSPNPSGESYSELVCNISNTKIRVGNWITLANSEEPSRRWEVIWKSEAMSPSATDWKVGGLS